MLTPTTDVVPNYLEFEKIAAEHLKLIERAHEIFSIEPQSIDQQWEWRVRFPDYCGTSHWYHSYFARNRWYETHHHVSDPLIRNRLQATAPSLVKLWEVWQDPLDFINLLSSEFTPLSLAMKYGSNLAALQLLVDLWDHLQIRDKFTIQLPSPLRTASLYSATSLLSWPSHFAQEMSHLSLRQNEHGGNRLSLELARNKTLTKNWLKALSTYSKSLETACHIRGILLTHLRAHQEQKLKLIPRWERNPNGTAKIVDKAGMMEISPPAPVPETIITSTPQLNLKVYVTRSPPNDTPGEKRVLPEDPPLKSALIGNKVKRIRISSVAIL
jgi:hypothetical protein